MKLALIPFLLFVEVPDFEIALWCLASSTFLAQLLEQLTLSELIQQCTERSPQWEQVWQEFERRYGGYVLKFVKRECGNLTSWKEMNVLRDTCEDLRQDVYVRLLENQGSALRDFRGQTEESFLAYLKAMARNITRNHFKQARREKRGSGRPDFSIDCDKAGDLAKPQTSETTQKLDYNFLVDDIMRELRQKYSDRNKKRDLLVFRLYYFDGYSVKEISETQKLDLTISGIENIVNRTRKFLQGFLER